MLINLPEKGKRQFCPIYGPNNKPVILFFQYQVGTKIQNCALHQTLDPSVALLDPAILVELNPHLGWSTSNIYKLLSNTVGHLDWMILQVVYFHPLRFLDIGICLKCQINYHSSWRGAIPYTSTRKIN